MCCENGPLIVTDNNPADPSSIESVPVDWESQPAQMMEELIHKEWEAQLRGEEGDPLFAEKLTAIFNSFYIKVVEPMLGSFIGSIMKDGSTST